MANKQLKEILDMAIQVKTDAYECYSAAAKIVRDPSAKELLNGFADIELKHRERFKEFDLYRSRKEIREFSRQMILNLS